MLLPFLPVNTIFKPIAIMVILFFSALLCPGVAIAQAELTVQNPWVKLAPPGASVNAAYMNLRNDSPEEKIIVAVSADCCMQVMMHQTRREGDKVYMDHHDRLIIPAQSELQLAPGGLHLMLLGANAPLTLNDKVNIHFDFADGTQHSVSIPVKKAADD